MTACLGRILNQRSAWGAHSRDRMAKRSPRHNQQEKQQTVNSFPEPHAVADSQPRSATAAAAESDRELIIVRWTVVGHDRLLGTIFGPLGQGGAPRTVMTSPVVQVRLVGSSGRPVAFTQSGSAYRLGEPSEMFGQGRAEKFVTAKARPPGEPMVQQTDMSSASIALDD